MLQNSFLKVNRFLKRENRFTNPTFVNEEYYVFDFNNNLKSNHLQQLEFTNYVSSNKCKKYMTLEEICKRIYKNEKEWEKLFVADEIDISKNVPKLERIYKIISNVNNDIVDKKELILKFKYIDDMEIQFYIKNNNGTLKLYLIDLYHIGIEATNNKNGRTDRKGIYRARKKCNFDIRAIQEELNKSADKPREI